MTAQDVRRTARPAPGGTLAHNYHPLPVTIATADGAWVTDTAGRRYLDLLAGYSALNFGHRHPALVDAAARQLGRVTLTSRAFDHDLLQPFADALAALVGPLTAGGGERADGSVAAGPGTSVLPMNTGAEAVETAIKTARKWGYDVRGVPPGEATIVVASGNFHGRTTTIVSFSDDPDARDGFAPYTPGFRVVPFGDADAVAAALDDTTVAVLMEPVQGESGVVVPPDGYWPALRALTAERDVLLVADEIQSGLGRTGTTLACELWDVRPDLVTLGKALGGGVVPVSAVVGRRDVLDVLTPGTHGSTFGGNPLACAVALAVVDLLRTGEPQAAARSLGAVFRARLDGLVDAGLLERVRGVGLWAGLDLDPARGTGRDLCEALLARGVLAKDTHGSTIRLAPPLTLTATDLETGLSALEDALTALAHGR
ncbi:ornithine--oxo-acid transaminase [Cellulosimicrobium marinum]|uniref:ornithine--oxo-acid transaminase n=1 Tax=Cellulosimicrobium marinum TaxID=1638992 RepID=UPI001E558362|nr:ornithine--oxo-acid transaminase [Cellulosimicrobium marinum]MCB7136956.1 ornithine--oxo-acid transaminase [Cellulosimicrobium marinum]